MGAAEAAQALRKRAQEEVRARDAQHPEDLSRLSPEAVQKLLYELHVHGIELELQNEELHLAQDELETSRARYFDLYDLAPVGYLTIGEDGLVREANLTAAGLLHVTTSALLKQPLTGHIFADDQDVYYRHRRRLGSGAPQVCELRLLQADGGVFWARLEARAAQGVDGTSEFRTVLSDITERKRVEERLKLSEARHRILFENSRDALMTLAPPGWQFTSGNAAAIAMFKSDDKLEFLSRTPWQYSPERQPDGSLSEAKATAMIDVAMREGSHSFEWTYRRVSGEEFQATVFLTRMEANGAAFLQATVCDNSEAQKQRGIVAQTERLASMGMLAASVGHEINNPLAYVLSNVESLAQTLPKIADIAERCCASLKREVGDMVFATIVGADAALLEPMLTEASEHARDALDGAQRITRISRALGTFSRVDALESVTVDVNYAIESAIIMVSNKIRFKAKLVKDLKPLPMVRGSEGKLSQVFLNLLINAAHAMPEGDIEDHCITVRTWTEAGNVFAEVKDTGRGIAPEDTERVFEPFFSTKALGVGTGLGLSICRNIIAEFGGKIQVQSEVGKGTSFVIRLPAQGEALAARSSEPTFDIPAIPAPPGRILVVDDEDPLRKMMKRLLVDHDVVLAASGKEAQALLEHDQQFDVILCDVMMPEMTGIDLHKWLKERNPFLADRVVFITGGAFGPAAAEYLVDFGNLRIAKPFDSRTFVRVVAERVRAAKRQAASAN
jgi:PAS domain S-box-containing protein